MQQMGFHVEEIKFLTVRRNQKLAGLIENRADRRAFQKPFTVGVVVVPRVHVHDTGVRFHLVALGAGISQTGTIGGNAEVGTAAAHRDIRTGNKGSCLCGGVEVKGDQIGFRGQKHMLLHRVVFNSHRA